MSGDIKRLENLKYKGVETGFIYMGSIDENRMQNEYYEIINEAVQSGKLGVGKTNYTEQELNEFFEENQEDDCGILDVMQKVVYYNPVINTSIIFEVIGDVCCHNYGHFNINDLIKDIYEGVNSLYADIQESGGKIEEDLKGYLSEKDSVVTIEYIDGEVVWCDMRIYKGVLKDVEIRELLDVFYSIKDKTSVSYFKR